MDWGPYSRDLKLLAAVRFMRSFTFGYVAYLLPLYLKSAGFSDVMIGLYVLIATASSAVLTLVSGYLGDLYSRKRTYLAMSLLPAATYTIVLLTRSRPLLMASAAFGLTLSPMGGGAGGGPVAPLQTAMVASRVSGGSRTQVYSLLMSLSIVSALAGGVFSSAIIDLEPHMYFVELFAVALAITLSSTLLILPLSEGPDRPREGRPRSIMPRRSARNIGKVATAGMFGSLGLGMVMSIISVYFKDIGATSLQVSLIFDGSYAATVVALLLARRAEESLGRLRAILVFRGLGSALLALIPFLPLAAAGAVFALRTALYQMSLPMRQSLTMDLYDPEERSRGLSISGVARRLPYGVASQVGSLLLQLGLYSVLFVAAGSIATLDPVLYYLFFRDVAG